MNVHGADENTMMGRAHTTAKKCPMRPSEQQLEWYVEESGYDNVKKVPCPFTIDQRDAWLGHVMCAAEECGASLEF